ncbi:MAG: adenosylcobinamide-GDP ribazoletransferase [Nitratireductor sp.]|nr:adenosylcobinamide-GDP ribazoletransferase [Nitratireductor sp.]
MDKVRDEIGNIIKALQFFTRLPLPARIASLADHSTGLEQSTRHFPVAGIAIGLLLAALFLLLSGVLPPVLASGLTIAAGMALTGALHEDGLADCADGLGGSNGSERALEIMKDSRIGAFGAAALIFSIGLRWAALASLAPVTGALALIICHSAARGSIAIALATSTYARASGTGSLVAPGIPMSQLAISAAISLLSALVLMGFAGVVAAIIGWLAALLFLLRFERRIGGYTGDCLGAMEQCGEIAIFLTIAAIVSG